MAGLLVRHFAAKLSVFGEYAPDGIWAMMVYFLFAFVAPKASIWKTGGAAIVFAYAIELSQLYHAPWIDHLRAYRLGGLILGFGFLWGDLMCYSVGVAVAMGIDASLKRLSVSPDQ